MIASRQFESVVTIDECSGFTDTVQDYWKRENFAIITQTISNYQTNTQPVQSLFLTTVHIHMGDLAVVAKFL